MQWLDEKGGSNGARKKERSYQFLAGQADGFAGPLRGGGAGSPPGVGQPEGGVVIDRHALHRQRPLILRQRLAQLMDRHLRIQILIQI